jgi:hypothetical protein
MIGGEMRKTIRGKQSSGGFGSGREKAHNALRNPPTGAPAFRRNMRDAAPPKEVVTGRMLGDPAPGRFNHQPFWKPTVKETAQ